MQLFDGETLFGLKVEGDVTVKDGVLILKATEKPATVTISESFPANGVWTIETIETGKAEGTWTVAEPPKRTWPALKMPMNGTAMKANFLSEVNGQTWKLNRKSPKQDAIRTTQANAPQVLGSEILCTSGTIAIKSLTFTPKPGESLFNGKDLTGWTLYKGEPKRELSKFEVTKDGELRVTNGPGDLRTDKAFADFMLQFQCKTNGKALNSGIFFRCIPDQYQNGYEAQIQNAFKDNDRTKPTDFGTGAIYRRIASRKVVSNDNEWFTMTVLAVGPRIRTWVNGYPTVDWVDDRPADENPRKGLRTTAGHFSIQGHDPTTDIVFKDFQVHDIKK
jgi:hypothetical protein